MNRVEHPKKISAVFTGQETQDGAGVKLKRVFGGHVSARVTDPFLLLDHFGSTKVEDYIKGFPWHPHRGIETVTYLLAGKVVHEDSEGHKGTIKTNDLQWMTAGSGIFHQEMPKPLDTGDEEELLKSVGLPTNLSGLQLWINLPAKHKMTTPTYRDMNGSNTPVVSGDGGSSVKVVAGEYNGVSGPFNGAYGVEPVYLDVTLPEESEFNINIKPGHTSLAYIFGGSGFFDKSETVEYHPGQSLVYSEEGNGISVRSGDSKLRFIVLSGRPLKEPVWWSGPIVMNSEEQIREAYLDLKKGTFIKEKTPVFVD